MWHFELEVFPDLENGRGRGGRSGKALTSAMVRGEEEEKGRASFTGRDKIHSIQLLKTKLSAMIHSNTKAHKIRKYKACCISSGPD